MHEVWKACLNIDGSEQQKGVNYWESYAAVCTWAAICLILVLVSGPKQLEDKAIDLV